ncbi:RNI-like protein [Ascodesmis nigricans]|uniref:RNI-like protein n=1 Tax=Ascodesmis nigricans TaxID=341454 RepID=A0A4S2N5Y6_9PEZI|nr:RNI-like protein [Ascodesmis nigricans]
MDSTDRHAQELQRTAQELALTHATRINTQVSILDNRAAVLAKAQPENLEPALRDARRIMKLQKANAVGYLRGGQILQLMGKMDMAIKTYEYGLTQIGIQDEKGKKQLTAMQEKLSARLAAKPRLDPLSSLPLEITHMILGNLLLVDIVRMQRVCKGWREFLLLYQCNMPHLDFTGAGKTPSNKTITKYLNRMQRSITTIIISKAKELQPNILKLLLETPEKLQKLYIGPIAPYTLLRFPYGIKFRPTLKTLEIHASMSNHYILYLLSHIRSLETLPVIDRFLPHLEELEIVHMGLRHPSPSLKNSNAMTRVVYNSCFLMEYPEFPESLTYLDLSSNPYLIFNPDLITAYPLPNLEELHVDGCSLLHGSQLEAMIEPAKQSGSLRTLSFDNVARVDCTNLEWLLTPDIEENLRELSLAGNPSVKSTTVADLLKLRGLEVLNLSWTKILGSDVLALVRDGPKKLRRLNLDYCDHISNDTVQYLRDLGLTVSFARSTVREKGRKRK